MGGSHCTRISRFTFSANKQFKQFNIKITDASGNSTDTIQDYTDAGSGFFHVYVDTKKPGEFDVQITLETNEGLLSLPFNTSLTVEEVDFGVATLDLNLYFTPEDESRRHVNWDVDIENSNPGNFGYFSNFYCDFNDQEDSNNNFRVENEGTQNYWIEIPRGNYEVDCFGRTSVGLISSNELKFQIDARNKAPTIQNVQSSLTDQNFLTYSINIDAIDEDGFIARVLVKEVYSNGVLNEYEADNFISVNAQGLVGGDGYVDIELIAVDGEGAESEPYNLRIDFENLAPSFEIIATLLDENTKEYRFDFEMSDDGYIERQVFTAIAPTGNVYSYDAFNVVEQFLNEAPGIWTIQVEGVDNFGKSTVKSIQVEVENKAPEVLALNVFPVNENERLFEIVPDVVDYDGYFIADELIITFPNGSTIQGNPGTGPSQWNLNEPGNYVISYRVQDNAGDWSELFTTNYSVINKAPVAVFEITQVSQDRWFVVTESSYDEDGFIIEHRFEFTGPQGESITRFESGSFDIQLASPGTWNVGYDVKDNDQEWSARESSEIEVINQAPTIEFTYELVDDDTNTYRFDVTYSDDFGDVQMFLKTTAPDGTNSDVETTFPTERVLDQVGSWKIEATIVDFNQEEIRAKPILIDIETVLKSYIEITARNENPNSYEIQWDGQGPEEKLVIIEPDGEVFLETSEKLLLFEPNLPGSWTLKLSGISNEVVKSLNVVHPSFFVSNLKTVYEKSEPLNISVLSDNGFIAPVYTYKFFIDGILASQTAILSESFEEPGDYVLRVEVTSRESEVVFTEESTFSVNNNEFIPELAGENRFEFIRSIVNSSLYNLPEGSSDDFYVELEEVTEGVTFESGTLTVDFRNQGSVPSNIALNIYSRKSNLVVNTYHIDLVELLPTYVQSFEKGASSISVANENSPMKNYLLRVPVPVKAGQNLEFREYKESSGSTVIAINSNFNPGPLVLEAPDSDLTLGISSPRSKLPVDPESASSNRLIPVYPEGERSSFNLCPDTGYEVHSYGKIFASDVYGFAPKQFSGNFFLDDGAFKYRVIEAKEQSDAVNVKLSVLLSKLLASEGELLDILKSRDIVIGSNKDLFAKDFKNPFNGKVEDNSSTFGFVSHVYSNTIFLNMDLLIQYDTAFREAEVIGTTLLHEDKHLQNFVKYNCDQFVYHNLFEQLQKLEEADAQYYAYNSIPDNVKEDEVLKFQFRPYDDNIPANLASKSGDYILELEKPFSSEINYKDRYEYRIHSLFDYFDYYQMIDRMRLYIVQGEDSEVYSSLEELLSGIYGRQAFIDSTLQIFSDYSLGGSFLNDKSKLSNKVTEAVGWNRDYTDTYFDLQSELQLKNYFYELVNPNTGSSLVSRNLVRRAENPADWTVRAATHFDTSSISNLGNLSLQLAIPINKISDTEFSIKCEAKIYVNSFTLGKKEIDFIPGQIVDSKKINIELSSLFGGQAVSNSIQVSTYVSCDETIGSLLNNALEYRLIPTPVLADCNGDGVDDDPAFQTPEGGFVQTELVSVSSSVAIANGARVCGNSTVLGNIIIEGGETLVEDSSISGTGFLYFGNYTKISNSIISGNGNKFVQGLTMKNSTASGYFVSSGGFIENSTLDGGVFYDPVDDVTWGIDTSGKIINSTITGFALIQGEVDNSILTGWTPREIKYTVDNDIFGYKAGERDYMSTLHLFSGGEVINAEMKGHSSSGGSILDGAVVTATARREQGTGYWKGGVIRNGAGIRGQGSTASGNYRIESGILNGSIGNEQGWSLELGFYPLESDDDPRLP